MVQLSEFDVARQEIYRRLYGKALQYQSNNGKLGGLLYWYEIATTGGDYYVFYPAGTPTDIIEAAESEARTRFDVATFTKIEIQPEWTAQISDQLQQLLVEENLTPYGAARIVGAETDRPLDAIEQNLLQWLTYPPVDWQVFEEAIAALGYRITLVKKS